MMDARQGIVHIVGPEQGFTQPARFGVKRANNLLRAVYDFSTISVKLIIYMILYLFYRYSLRIHAIYTKTAPSIPRRGQP